MFDERFLDQIYEVGLCGDKWTNLLQGFADKTGARYTLFATFQGTEMTGFTGNPDGAEIVKKSYELYEALPVKPPVRNLRAERLFERKHAGFISELDLISENELRDDFVLANFIVPMGRFPSIGTHIDGFLGQNALISFEGLGPETNHDDLISRLDSIRPHLCRSASLSSSLRLERARSMTDALKMVGMAAAVLSYESKVLSVNSYFHETMDPYFSEAMGRLRSKDAYLNTVFQEEVEKCLRRSSQARSLPLVSDKDERPLVMHLFPIRGEARDLFTSNSVLIVVAGGARDQIKAPLLQQLFDLTPAEARLASRIGEGISLEQISRETGKSIHTIRNQTKSILNKTGLG